MRAASATPGVRARRPAARRRRGAAAGDGEAGGGARRRHRRRRDRAGRGPARGGRAGVLRARRPGPRPARLGRRQGRGGHHRRAGRAVPRPGLRRRGGRDRRTTARGTPTTAAPAGPARGAGARAAAGRRRGRGVAARAARQPGEPAGAAARRQEGAAGDRGPQRGAVAGAAQDPAGQRPDHAQPRRWREIQDALGLDDGAAADRVLRRLQPAGHARGRVDGGVRGRPGPQVASTAGSRSRAWTAPTTSRPSTRSITPPVPPLPATETARTASGRRPTGADPTASRARHRPEPAGRASSPTRRTCVVVDGGPPRWPRPRAALDELGIDDVAVCGLAKRLEEVWLPGEDGPVILPRTSEGLYLLQRVRDEAHRFAITYHRQKRSAAHDGQRAGRRCRAWARPGGQALLRQFGSVRKLPRGDGRRDRGGARDSASGPRRRSPPRCTGARRAATGSDGRGIGERGRPHRARTTSEALSMTGRRHGTGDRHHHRPVRRGPQHRGQVAWRTWAGSSSTTCRPTCCRRWSTWRRRARARCPGSRRWSTCAAGRSRPTCESAIGDLDARGVRPVRGVPGGLRRRPGPPVRERAPAAPAAGGRPAGGRHRRRARAAARRCAPRPTWCWTPPR